MVRSKIVPLKKIGELIPDGAVVTVSSSSGLGCPDAALHAIGAHFLEKGHPLGLTALHPIAAGDMYGIPGIDHLAHPGLLKRVIAGSFPSGPSNLPSPKIWQMIIDNQVEAYNVPSGTLSYQNNFIDLDPHLRDRSGVGLPVLRITYDLRENEHRLADWMEAKSEEILHQMGATRTWRGDRFTGVGSSHDFGGARMGDDPEKRVVSPELEVHDTPGLYVFSGATFPTCPGINPTLSLLALAFRAAERLVRQLTAGDHS
jgi:GMC oxidoreductase